MSPRPKKTRRCEGNFRGKTFKPSGISFPELKHIKLYRDELEALKLCDFEGLFQEQAGKKMGVSRGTVQRILTSARKKTAEALATGAALVYEGEGD